MSDVLTDIRQNMSDSDIRQQNMSEHIRHVLREVDVEEVKRVCIIYVNICRHIYIDIYIYICVCVCVWGVCGVDYRRVLVL